MVTRDFDVVVVGSGFGGSVAALRLAEKGYRVGVLEAGRRFTSATLPKNSWDARGALWAPRLGLRGILRIDLLSKVVVLSGAGVGGGSLVYANVHYQAPPEVLAKWPGPLDWARELAPCYDQVARMFGVVEQPSITPADKVVAEIADELGVGDSVRRTPVAVFFGMPAKTVPDPYFGGAGPDRTGCTECGDCMVGCRVGAKNRLDLNYLHLAERVGATIIPDTTVTALRETDVGRRWEVRAGDEIFRCDQVVLAAGVLGTQRLLQTMKVGGTLPKVSDRLGTLFRTNSEALLTASALRVPADPYSRGVAITSSFHPDEHTHIQPVRWGPGSNVTGLFTAPLVDGGGHLPRTLRFLGVVARHPVEFAQLWWKRRWSERTIVALVMQTLDNSLTFRRTRRGRLVADEPREGTPAPKWIPIGYEVVRSIARKIHGVPTGAIGDVFDVPMTVHPLGGATISESAESGVVDLYHRVHGYESLHVFDGSAVPSNLGVNPSMTITAMAERAASRWPNAGDPDPRPAPGAPYQQVDPVAPRTPAVPAPARTALVLRPA